MQAKTECGYVITLDTGKQIVKGQYKNSEFIRPYGETMTKQEAWEAVLLQIRMAMQQEKMKQVYMQGYIDDLCDKLFNP
jgi:hypothetical protein